MAGTESGRNQQAEAMMQTSTPIWNRRDPVPCRLRVAR